MGWVDGGLGWQDLFVKSLKKTLFKISGASYRDFKTSTASDESDPTCTKYAEGCTSEIKMSTVRRRDTKKNRGARDNWRHRANAICDSAFFNKTAAATKKLTPRHSKSCTCHAKSCQHKRSKNDDRLTKRACRGLQKSLQYHQILRVPRN